MTAHEAFQPILDRDETIIESFKPKKSRFVILGIISDIVKGIGIAFFGLIFLLVGIFGEGEWTDAETGEVVGEFGQKIPIIIGAIVLGFAALTIIIAIIWRLVKYQKVFFCYTNKRILIRSGFIGADFQTLDFDLIGAMNVRVDFFDKFFHPNTGTVIFASAASPILANGLPGGTSSYMFVNIENPYEVYKRIKEYSSDNKDGKLNS